MSLADPASSSNLGKILGGVFGGLGGLVIIILLFKFLPKTLDYLDQNRENCSCIRCGELLFWSIYLLYLVIGMILLILLMLIVPVAVVPLAI